MTNNLKAKALTNTFGLIFNEFNNLLTFDTENIKKLLYKHKLLIFKNVNFSNEKYIKFANCFGELVQFVDEDYRHPDYPDIFVVSNIQKNGRKFGKDRVGYYWHSDSSFMKEPLPITMLYSQIVPNSGGETAFIDMENTYHYLYKQLPNNLDLLSATHEGKWRYLITEKDLGLSIQEILDRDETHAPSQMHPLIINHPKVQRKALYLSQGITKRITNITETENEIILTNFWNYIENSAEMYKHKWETNELIIWDNRSLIHRAYPSHPGESRLMFRIGVRDGSFFG